MCVCVHNDNAALSLVRAYLLLLPRALRGLHRTLPCLAQRTPRAGAAAKLEYCTVQWCSECVKAGVGSHAGWLWASHYSCVARVPRMQGGSTQQGQADNVCVANRGVGSAQEMSVHGASRGLQQ